VNEDEVDEEIARLLRELLQRREAEEAAKAKAEAEKKLRPPLSVPKK
jgi:hypothetical protein